MVHLSRMAQPGEPLHIAGLEDPPERGGMEPSSRAGQREAHAGGEVPQQQLAITANAYLEIAESARHLGPFFLQS